MFYTCKTRVKSGPRHLPHKLERPSAALVSPGDYDLWLVGRGRAGGVAGAGVLAGELPRRVKPKKTKVEQRLDQPARHGRRRPPHQHAWGALRLAGLLPLRRLLQLA